MKNFNFIKRLWVDSHEKHLPQRFGHYAAILIMLLTLGVGQMWGADVEKNARIYFDNSASNWDYSYRYFVINDDKGYPMSPIDRSKLYYHKRSANTWGGYSYIRLFAASGSWGGDDASMGGYTNMYNNCSNMTNTYNNYGFGSGGYHFIKPSKKGSKSDQASLTITYHGDKPTCVSTAKARVRSNYDGSYSTISTGSWPATVDMEGTYWDGDGASGHSNAATNSGASGTYTNMYTGLVEMSISSLNSQYTFDGWATSAATSPSNTNATYSYNITSATTVYAYFTKKWTITFDKNGHGDESTPSTQYVAEGKKISAVSDLSETGYTFGGWYTNQECTGSAWNFSSNTVSEDITLYAKWTPTDYTITYTNMTGATNHASNPSTYTIESAAITLQDPKKTGYLFDGWYTDKELTTPVGTPAIAAGSTGNKVFYAKWTEITLTEVSASPSTGGTGVQSMTVSFKTNVPRNSGYYYRVVEFGGVDAGTTGGGFHSNGNLISTGDAATLITSASFPTINFATSGVYTSAIEIYTDGPVVQKRVTFTYGAGNYYTVSFNMQGHGSDIDNQVILSGSYADEPDAPSETGYTFGGWYKEAACTNAWNFASDAVTSDKTLFAKWTANQYTITFDKEGGSGGSDNVTVYYDATLGAFATAPTRTGYTFAGYWTGDNGTGTMLFAANGAPQASVGSYTDGSVKWIYAGNPTVYAKWTENTTTVTVNVSPAKSGTLTVGGSAFTPGNTTTAGVATNRTVVASANSGYGFDYWTTSGNATGSASTNTYTLAGNGNGSTGTLTANFYTKVNSGWYLIGGPFGSWDTDNHNYLIDRQYREVSNVYYRVVDFGGTAQYFKPLNGGTIYGQSSGSDQEMTTGTMYSIVSGQTANGTAFKSKNQGNVWVVVNTSSNKMWIQNAATYYTITFANGSSGNTNNGVAGTEGTITTKTSNYGELSTKKFASGETIKLNVSAKTGYVIDDITIGETSVATDVNSTSYSGNTTMPAGDATLTVTYKHNYTVTYGVGTSYTSMGSVSSSPAHTSGQRVIEGTSMTFTATPNLGYKFVGWYREAACTNEVSTDNPHEPTINATTTLYAKYELLTLYMNSDINNWASEINLTHTTENAAIYKYTGTLNANPTNDAPTYASGWHFEYCYDAARNEKAYQYTSVQTPNYSGSSIDGVHTYSGANTIQFGLTRKSDVTIMLTLQTAPTMPTLNIDADPYYTITYGVPTHGSYTIQVGSAAAVGASTESTAGKTITLVPSASPGYHFDSWTVTKAGEGTVTVTSNQFTMPSDDVTIAATFLPTSYDVTLKPNGATTGSDQVVRATFDAAMPTTTKTSSALVAPTKTGYTLQGFYQNSDGTGTKYYNANMTSANAWDQAGDANVWAKWQAKTTTISYSQSGSGYSTGGQSTTQTATYDAAMPTPISTPTAANGYAFMGYYDALEPLGNKYYNADGTSARTWNKEDAEVTLYAYFKQAEITNLVAAPGVIAPGETITITPTIEPTPTGTTKVCYELQYSNGTSLPSQPTFTPGVGNAVSFPVPNASATYIIQAVLETGSTCGSGTELSRRTTTFQVAGSHSVSVQYKCGDRTIAASTSVSAQPLDWSEEIEAPTITGYTFVRWDAGDGVSIKNGNSDPVTTTTTPSIQIKAVYDGTLTAVYNKKNMIFFNNTLGWSDVYVYFYSSEKYWVNDHIDGQGCGTGSDQSYEVGGSTAYYRGYHGHMTQIEGTNIWYYDYEAEHGAKDGGEIKGYEDVVFVETEQNNYKFFHNNKAARRGDFKHSLPMFVPINSITETKNGTKYYSSGYWMNYPENTGYSLLIYNQKAKAGATKLYELPFEYTEDKTMPMELVVDLEAGQTYGFEIKRADGNYYSNTGTMTANSTNWAMETEKASYCGLQTTAAGDYTIRLYYSSSNYKIDVTYPVAVNDYRIVYTDLATWSKTAHTASWNHPSRVITKNSSATEIKKDTVSFFWSYGSTPAIKYQTCTAVAAGSASWNAGTAIDVSGFSSVLTKNGVYNFIFEQPAGGASISLVGVEPYTGNYYIRTDCAGSTKWSNFRSLDHQMTYSDYAETTSGYSHYYTHWVLNGTNVKFCIANDYSMCITDTLEADYGTTIANIASGGALNSASANIRFMWNQATNKISRAYISGSTNISDRFLVLEGDAKMYDENGNTLNITGLNANEINLVDDQNFLYERTIEVNTGARAKLTAKYNNNVQYFKGSAGAFEDGTTVELLGGDASGKHTMRIVYDFKTNRLVTAYVPSSTIDKPIAINADLMIVREHQEEGQQLRFESEGALSEVHTVYGVMRFNRWTLNNKEKTGVHSPVGDPKSIYERSLYWISFPFDVNLGDVFGFGTYGVDWIIEYYDGAERATKGFWADSPGFWKMYTNRAGVKLEAGKGYVLAIDLDRMKDNNTDFWVNNIEQVELFFPSATNVEDISKTTAHTVAESHLCSIDRTNSGGTDINKNRTKADSHWNMIGVPSYANYGEALTSDGSSATITWNSNPYTNDLPFLYEWNMTDDSYTVQSGTTYPFKAMHSYMVQYSGDLYWSLASATPTSPIVARRTYAQAPQSTEFRLELRENEKMADQTFIRFSNDEEVSMNFNFNEDLFKEFNGGKANIYTLIENYIPAAGNILPTSEQTTVIPVGVKIVSAGEYTFSIPNGTGGVSVVLIDNITGTHTNLALADYTVTLGEGTLSDRFTLEVSPIQQMTTEIEETEFVNHESASRKLLIDGILYIIKDGKVFDARGARIQ